MYQDNPKEHLHCMASAQSQKGDPSLVPSFFLKPFGGLPIALRTKTEPLPKAFQAAQIWPSLIPPSFLVCHTPATLTFQHFLEHTVSSAKNRPPSPSAAQCNPFQSQRKHSFFFKGRFAKPPDWIRFPKDLVETSAFLHRYRIVINS